MLYKYMYMYMYMYSICVCVMCMCMCYYMWNLLVCSCLLICDGTNTPKKVNGFVSQPVRAISCRYMFIYTCRYMYMPCMYICVYVHCRIVLSDCTVLGPLRTITLEPDVRRAVHQMYNFDIALASAFDRAVIKGETFYSTSYNRSKLRNSYTAEYIDNNIKRLCFINYFVSLPSCTIVVITPLSPTLDHCYPNNLEVLCKNIVPIHVEASIAIISSKCLLRKCVCVSFCGRIFITKPPNPLRYD